MATKMVCDRCGADITGITSGSVTAAWDVDDNHSFEGDADHDHDLCSDCYAEYITMYNAWVAEK